MKRMIIIQRPGNILAVAVWPEGESKPLGKRCARFDVCTIHTNMAPPSILSMKSYFNGLKR